MMVGVTISMIAILAMMTVYKTTLRVSGEARRGAATDGQRLAALFAAQSLLQEAGFGIASAAYGTDMVVLSGAVLEPTSKKLSGTAVGSLPASGNAIVWGTQTDGSNYMCNGLYAPTDGGLIRLPAIACTGATAAASVAGVAWNKTVLVDDKTAGRSILIRVKTAAPCQPFGIGGSGNMQAVLETQNSTGASAVASTCLANF
jgi:hypothetical protein